MTASFNAHQIQRPSEIKLAREQQQVSVELASQQTGIPPQVIRALEQDGGQSLAPPYRRAYLVKYAAFLGLWLSADWLNEVSVSEPLQRMPRLAVLGRDRPQSQRSGSWMRYLIASVLVVPSLLWVFVDQSAQWVTSGLGQGEIVGPTSAMEVRHIRASQLPARPMSSGPVDEANIALSTEQSINEETDSLDSTDAQTTFVLSLVVVRDGWVELRDASGKRLEHDLLRADTERAYEGAPPFDILLGMGQSVRLALNGQPINHLLGSELSSAQTDATQGLMAFRVLADGRLENQ